MAYDVKKDACDAQDVAIQIALNTLTLTLSILFKNGKSSHMVLYISASTRDILTWSNVPSDIFTYFYMKLAEGRSPRTFRKKVLKTLIILYVFKEPIKVMKLIPVSSITLDFS